MKKLSLLAMLTVLIGSALFVTSCGAKITADTVWQVTKVAGVSAEETKIYVCFGADNKLYSAIDIDGTLVKNPTYTGDYTAKNGKIKAPFIAGAEADYTVKDNTMTISSQKIELYVLKKVETPTAKAIKDAK